MFDIFSLSFNNPLESVICLLFLLIPIFLYAIFILWISHHWFHNEEYKSIETTSHTTVSVLIPFKNEKDKLSELINQLKAQTYPQELVEYIFVNDHSTDGGENLFAHYPQLFLLANDSSGKKGALETGLRQAIGELIITLDADCQVGKSWLSTIVSFYEYSQADLIICPVNLSPITSLWDKLQAIEFQSLMASTAGAALGGKPIMCNGANLAFKKALVEDEDDVFNRKYASGDDMFLLEHSKCNKASIAYLKSREAIATTQPENWKRFWRQRSRWTSKSGGYRDIGIITSGVLVLLANMSLLILPFISLKLALIALLVKLFVDYILLCFSASFFRTKKSLWLTIIITPVYPFYVLFAALGGFFSKLWK